MIIQQCVLVLAFVLFLPRVSRAQRESTSVATSPMQTQQLSTLRAVGEQVVDALKDRDVTPLALIVDEGGISLGTDNAPISAAAFRGQLHKKMAVYCDLMGCARGATSLHAMLKGKNPKIRISLSNDFPNVGQVDVFDIVDGAKTQTVQRSPLFTLFFIRRHGRWYLQQIEYT